MDNSVAVIGAGMSGLACAQKLQAAGFDVRVFDKGRGPGGRMSTRRGGEEGFVFDHGCQYLTARHPGFARAVERWREAQIIAPWSGRFAYIRGRTWEAAKGGERFVGLPGMSAVTGYMGKGLDVRYGVEVAAPELASGHWRLLTKDGEALGSFATVIVATPAPQAVKLLEQAPQVRRAPEMARMAPSWTLMVAFKKRLRVPFDGAHLGEDGAVAWIGRDSSKPARGEDAYDRWVVQANGPWSENHLEDDPEDAADHLLRAFYGIVDVRAVSPVYQKAHRWRYAQTAKPMRAAAFFDAEANIGTCGDWCLGRRAEHAWISGTSLADTLIASRPREFSQPQALAAPAGG
jgi:hypothetical protein